MALRLRPREGWGTIVLLTLMMLSVAWAIAAAKWTEGLWTLQLAVLGGVAIGLIFGAFRRLPGIIAHLLSLALGVAWVVFVTAWLLPWEYTWGQAIAELATRFTTWLVIALGKGTSSDNLIFVMQLEFLMWLIGYAGAWFLIRSHNVWGAIIPSGLAMMVSVYYAPQTDNWLAFYLLCALLLVVRTFVLDQQDEWQRSHVGYNPDIGFDFLRDGAVFATLVVFVTWFAPAITTPPDVQTAFDRLSEPWSRAQAQFNRLFSALNYRPRPGPAYFSNTLAFTGPVNLGDAPVFEARASSGRYWRSVVYDQYTSRGWVNTDATSTLITPGDPRLSSLPFEERQIVTQTVTILQSGGTMLHAQSLPVEINLPARAQFTSISDDPSDQGPLNISMLSSRTALKTGQSYQVLSGVSSATIKQLQEAGEDYPDWVTERYLQLPDSLPPRVRELAEQITAPYSSPYDKATALESFLRNLPYNDQIPAPPAGRDGVDYFLFDIKQGYCDYYASALVTMARALRIPARLAAGYSSGEYDASSGVYRQREYDAHSWPEVYFPNYGWVEFEPTAGDPLVNRPTEPPEPGAFNQGERTNPQDRPGPEANIPEGEELGQGGLPFNLGEIASRGLPRPWIALGALAMLGLIAATGAWLRWERGFRGLSLAAGLYERMMRLGRLMGVVGAPSQTPYEYADTLGEAIPRGQPDIHEITDHFVREQFSGRIPAEEEGLKLADSWLRLRQVLLQSLVEHGLGRLAGQRASKR